MRLLFSLVLMFPLLAFSAGKCVIKGNISGSPDGVIGLVVNKTHIRQASETTTTNLNDGKFQFEFDLAADNVVDLVFNGKILELFVEPGDLIEITADADDYLSSAKFTGNTAANNTFLAAFNLEFKDVLNEDKTLENLQTFSVDAFEMNLYDNMKRLRAYYEDAPQESDFTPDFKAYMDAQIKFYYLGNLYAYASLKSKNELRPGELPSIMLKDVSPEKLYNNEQAMASFYYRKFLQYATAYHTAELNGFKKFEDYDDFLDRKYNYALKSLKGTSFEYVLAKSLYDHCNDVSPSTAKKIYRVISNVDQSKAYTRLIDEHCSDILSAKDPKSERAKKDRSEEDKVEKGKSKYDFEMVDLDGKKISIDDFRGKVVYVDFWASWCGPCRQQFPYSKQLHNMFTKDQLKQIVFLYISIDNSDAAWRNAVEKFGLEGENANSPGGWGSGAAKYFNVTSIPRYMLVDKKGNIVQMNAKRPSTGEAIKEDILMLLD